MIIFLSSMLTEMCRLCYILVINQQKGMQMTELENKAKIWMSEREMKRMFALPRPAAKALEEAEAKFAHLKNIPKPEELGVSSASDAIRTS